MTQTKRETRRQLKEHRADRKKIWLWVLGGAVLGFASGAFLGTNPSLKYYLAAIYVDGYLRQRTQELQKWSLEDFAAYMQGQGTLFDSMPIYVGFGFAIIGAIVGGALVGVSGQHRLLTIAGALLGFLLVQAFWLRLAGWVFPNYIESPLGEFGTWWGIIRGTQNVNIEPAEIFREFWLEAVATILTYLFALVFYVVGFLIPWVRKRNVDPM